MKIRISAKQVDWISWMLEGPSFSEYHSKSFARDRELTPKEQREYIQAFDQVGYDKDALEFEFPNHEEVVSEIQFDLDRLIDILEDGKTGYWEENDRRIFGEQQSVRSLLRKINLGINPKDNER